MLNTNIGPSVFNVADWFLSREKMTPKKLQKIVYYYYAWGQALLNRDVITDAVFEAWVHGPVNRELYYNYKDYGWNHINESNLTTYDFDESEIELLESVWLTYGDKSGNELEALTRRELPWIKARGTCSENEICTNKISSDDMRSYYLSIYEGNQGD